MRVSALAVDASKSRCCSLLLSFDVLFILIIAAGLRRATALSAKRFLLMSHSVCDVNGWSLLHSWETFNAKLTQK